MFQLPVVPRTWIIVAVVVLVSGVVANTYRLSAAVDREHAALVQCEADKVMLQANIKTLADAIADQNATIENWKRLTDTAATAAEKALAEVERLAASRKQVTADLETWKRRAGENECDAARRLLLEYPR